MAALERCHFPIIPVRYPSRRSAAGSVGSSKPGTPGSHVVDPMSIFTSSRSGTPLRWYLERGERERRRSEATGVVARSRTHRYLSTFRRWGAAAAARAAWLREGCRPVRIE